MSELPMTDLPPLTTETLWAILNNEVSDDTVNQLVWHYLGYRLKDSSEPNGSDTDGSDTDGSDSEEWLLDSVDAAWAEKYPTPPDFIESRPATVQLTRSIPKENKQLLKTLLGFKGYSVDQLVPRLTRRATMANWLLSEMRSQGLV